MTLAWMAVFAAALAIAPHGASASTSQIATLGGNRYALVIASSRGVASEHPLHYAYADAQRVTDVLTELGDFRADNIVTLHDPSVDAVKTAFASLRGRIAADGGNNSFLFVYYSGHADALALHLGATPLPWPELMDLTNHAMANARLVVVDACRSGELTEVKGIRRYAPFTLTRGGSELPQGFAVLTSASAGESAQESHELEGSFFTHHFVAALRGAGDINHDGRVTLNEAFQYSSEQTSASTASTLVGVQHATYRYRMQGHGDLSLTASQAAHGLVALHIGRPGTYLLRQDSPTGPMALEANIDQGARAVWLSPGKYYVQRRTPEALYQGSINLTSEQSLDKLTWNTTPYETGVALKGEPDPEIQTQALPEPPAWQFGAWGGTGAALLPHFATPWMTGLTASRRLGPIRLDVQAGFTQALATTNDSTTRESDITLAVGPRYGLVSNDYIELSVGARLGALLLTQAYSGPGSGPNGVQVVPQGQALARFDVFLPYNFILFVEADGRVAPVWVRDNQGTKTEVAVQPVGLAGLSTSW